MRCGRSGCASLVARRGLRRVMPPTLPFGRDCPDLRTAGFRVGPVICCARRTWRLPPPSASTSSRVIATVAPLRPSATPSRRGTSPAARLVGNRRQPNVRFRPCLKARSDRPQPFFPPGLELRGTSRPTANPMGVSATLSARVQKTGFHVCCRLYFAAQVRARRRAPDRPPIAAAATPGAPSRSPQAVNSRQEPVPW